MVIDGVGVADTVSTLKARLSLAPELSGCAFYTMHGSSYMVDWLTLGDYNVQSRSTIRVLYHDALPGGVGDYFTLHKPSIEDAIAAALPEVMLQEPADPVGVLAQLLTAHSTARAGAPLASVATSHPPPPPPLPPPPLLEIHYKARSQDNRLYPTRKEVDDALTSWGVDYPDYSPEEWTADDVLANDRDLRTGGRWADPPDVKRAGLDQRVSYAANGQATAVLLDDDGMPRNPAGRTGLRGRGLLGKWGPNQAADPIVTRYDPQTQKLQMVAIHRKDTGEWAIPGGMVDDGEVVSATLRRACNIEGDEAREQVAAPQTHTLALNARSRIDHAPLCVCASVEYAV